LVTDYPLGARRTAAPRLNAELTTVEWPARRGCAEHHRSRPRRGDGRAVVTRRNGLARVRCGAGTDLRGATWWTGKRARAP